MPYLPNESVPNALLSVRDRKYINGTDEEYEPYERESEMWKYLSPYLTKELLVRIQENLMFIGDDKQLQESINYLRIGGELSSVIPVNEPSNENWNEIPPLIVLLFAEPTNHENIQIAMLMAKKIRNEDDRDKALHYIALRAAQAGFIADSLSAAKETRLDHIILATIQAIPAHILEKDWRVAYDAILDAVPSYARQAPFFVALLPHLPDNLQQLIIEQAKVGPFAHEKANDLATLAEKASPRVKLQVLREALDMLNHIDDILWLGESTAVPMVIQRILQHMHTLQEDYQLEIFRRLLRILSERTRSEMVRVIEPIGLSCIRFGDPHAYKHIAQAIEDVGRWWP